jgi:hypothetical protein
MSDNETRRALAIELIDEVFTSWEERGKPWQTFHGVLKPKAKDGVPIAVYANRSTEGFGDFICQYWPLGSVEKIIADCEKIFDNTSIEIEGSRLNFSEAEWEPGARERAIRDMTAFATQVFLLGIRSLICDAIEEGLADSLFLAQAALINDTAVDNDLPEVAQCTSDGRPVLDQIVKRVAKRKRELLVGLLGALPRIITKGRVGRPLGSTKPENVKEKEKEELVSQIEHALRRLVSASQSVPTKTAVARELGIGGLNPNTGNDSSLQAFNSKLNRYEIDYNQIVLRVLGE